MPAGRRSEIVNVIRRIKGYAKKYPIRSFPRLAPLAGVHTRTLEAYMERGETEAAAGKEPYDTKTRKGSRFVQFYRLIEEGRSRAHFAALAMVIASSKVDVRSAYKYLAITDSENWAETNKHEVDSTVHGGVTIEELHRLAKEHEAEVGKRKGGDHADVGDRAKRSGGVDGGPSGPKKRNAKGTKAKCVRRDKAGIGGGVGKGAGGDADKKTVGKHKEVHGQYPGRSGPGSGGSTDGPGDGDIQQPGDGGDKAGGKTDG